MRRFSELIIKLDYLLRARFNLLDRYKYRLINYIYNKKAKI